jgi:hypothetical protein
MVSLKRKGFSRNPKRLFGRSMAVALLLLSVACSAAATASPAPTKAPQAAAAHSPAPGAPGAEAKPAPVVTATPKRVTAAKPAPANPTSLYWPTYADYETATSPLWSPEGTSRFVHPILQDWFLEYAIGYAATECVAGRELSSEGFRAFVTEMNADSKGGFVNHAPMRNQAFKVIGQMMALSASGARLDCLNPYVYPTTGTEASLAVDLVSFPTGIPWNLRVSSRAVLNEWAWSWLSEGPQHGESILQRFRDKSSSLKNVEIPAHVPVPKNTRGLNVHAWAVERELWEIRQTKADKEFR